MEKGEKKEEKNIYIYSCKAICNTTNFIISWNGIVLILLDYAFLSGKSEQHF